MVRRYILKDLSTTIGILLYVEQALEGMQQGVICDQAFVDKLQETVVHFVSVLVIFQISECFDNNNYII